MKHIKTLIVWFLLFAIPLQGYASVSMALCKSGTARMASLMSTTQASHAGGGEHRHDCAAAGEVIAHHDAAADDDAHCGVAADAMKCSSCSSCCVGAAIAPTFQALAGAEALGSERIPYIADHVTAYVPGGLERPPHSLHA